MLQTLSITSWETAEREFPFVASLGRPSRVDLDQKYDFYLVVAGLWLLLHEQSPAFQESVNLQLLRRLAQEWDRDVERAVSDISNFVSMFPGEDLRELVGAWIVWNLKRAKPTTPEEFRAAKGFGEMMGFMADAIRSG